MISAAITPGTQPHSVSKNTMINDPQPLSTMAKGGKIIQRRTRQMDITIDFKVFANLIENLKFQTDL